MKKNLVFVFILLAVAFIVCSDDVKDYKKSSNKLAGIWKYDSSSIIVETNNQELINAIKADFDEDGDYDYDEFDLMVEF